MSRSVDIEVEERRSKKEVVRSDKSAFEHYQGVFLQHQDSTRLTFYLHFVLNQ